MAGCSQARPGDIPSHLWKSGECTAALFLRLRVRRAARECKSLYSGTTAQRPHTLKHATKLAPSHLIVTSIV